MLCCVLCFKLQASSVASKVQGPRWLCFYWVTWWERHPGDTRLEWRTCNITYKCQVLYERFTRTIHVLFYTQNFKRSYINVVLSSKILFTMNSVFRFLLTFLLLASSVAAFSNSIVRANNQRSSPSFVSKNHHKLHALPPTMVIYWTIKSGTLLCNLKKVLMFFFGFDCADKYYFSSLYLL